MLFSLGLLFHLLVLATSATSEENKCETGWKYSPPSNTCVSMFGGKKAWVLAEAECRSYGGNLVCIPNMAMSKFMKANFNGSNDNPYWIGLNDRVSEGIYKWRKNSMDVQLHYSNWGPGQPNNALDQHCVAVGYHENQKWDDENCSDEYSYLCEKSMQGNECPEGWTHNPVTRTCLKMFDDKQTWMNASMSCMKNSALLVKITNEWSSNFIQSLFMGNKINPLWIGLNDRTYQGSYRWQSSNGELEWELLDWDQGQPNNYRNQDCVSVGRKDKQTWADDDCWTPFRFVCEKPPNQ